MDNSSFAILLKETKVKPIANKKKAKFLILSPGSTIKIIKQCVEEIYLQVLDFWNNNKSVNTEIYQCSAKDILILDEKIWSFTIAIKDAQKRIRFAKNKEQQNFILQLSNGDQTFVYITDDNNFLLHGSFLCVVKFFGHINGFCGLHFGLQFMVNVVFFTNYIFKFNRFFYYSSFTYFQKILSVHFVTY